MQECERVISKTLPACVAFHKPSFLQQLKNTSMDPTMVSALLTTGARYVLSLFPRRPEGSGWAWSPTGIAGPPGTWVGEMVLTSAIDIRRP